MTDRVFKNRLIDLYKIIIARSDINAAMDSCDLMLGNVKDFYKDYKKGLYVPLLNAIIICYARPFSQNKPFGPINSKWINNFDNRQKEIHHDLLFRRNRMIAHSDFNIRKIIIYPEKQYAYKIN